MNATIISQKSCHKTDCNNVNISEKKDKNAKHLRVNTTWWRQLFQDCIWLKVARTLWNATLAWSAYCHINGSWWWCACLSAHAYALFTARRYAQRGICHANSVCPSVRLSVTRVRVYCIKTAERIIEILSRSDRPIILVFHHRGA